MKGIFSTIIIYSFQRADKLLYENYLGLQIKWEDVSRPCRSEGPTPPGGLPRCGPWPGEGHGHSWSHWGHRLEGQPGLCSLRTALWPLQTSENSECPEIQLMCNQPSRDAHLHHFGDRNEAEERSL